LLSFREKVVNAIQQEPEPQEPQKPPPLPVNITEKATGDHRLTQQTMAQLERPAARPDGLSAYCGALVNDLAYLSWNGSKRDGGGARKYGYTEKEFNRATS
jgi:hypothetical protein